MMWYHWDHPDATHLMLTCKMLGYRDQMYLSFPANITFLDLPAYRFEPGWSEVLFGEWGNTSGPELSRWGDLTVVPNHVYWMRAKREECEACVPLNMVLIYRDE